MPSDNLKSIIKQKGVLLSVFNPCIVQIELVGKEYVVSVQDQEMNKDLMQITVIFNNNSFVFELPQGKLSRKPVVQKLSF